MEGKEAAKTKGSQVSRFSPEVWERRQTLKAKVNRGWVLVLVAALVMALARLLPASGTSATSWNLRLNYNTGMDGTLLINGTGTDVTGVSAYMKWPAGGDVTSQGGVNGTTSFALLSGTYNVVSVKGASSRTDSGIVVASGQFKNIPSGLLKVTYYANNNLAWGLTGVSVYVKWAANNGDVTSAGGVSNETSFALLSSTGTGTSYNVVSVKGASNRTEARVNAASTQTLDVPVARFRVAVVKADFTDQTGVSVYVKINANNGDVNSAGGVNGKVDSSVKSPG